VWGAIPGGLLPTFPAECRGRARRGPQLVPTVSRHFSSPLDIRPQASTKFAPGAFRVDRGTVLDFDCVTNYGPHIAEAPFSAVEINQTAEIKILNAKRTGELEAPTFSFHSIALM
jgi:hypothetical protein